MKLNFRGKRMFLIAEDKKDHNRLAELSNSMNQFGNLHPKITGSHSKFEVGKGATVDSMEITFFPEDEVEQELVVKRPDLEPNEALKKAAENYKQDQPVKLPSVVMYSQACLDDALKTQRIRSLTRERKILDDLADRAKLQLQSINTRLETTLRELDELDPQPKKKQAEMEAGAEISAEVAYNRLHNEIMGELFSHSAENRLLRAGKMSSCFYDKIEKCLRIGGYAEGVFLIWGKSHKDFEVIPAKDVFGEDLECYPAAGRDSGQAQEAGEPVKAEDGCDREPPVITLADTVPDDENDAHIIKTVKDLVNAYAPADLPVNKAWLRIFEIRDLIRRGV